MKKLLIKTICLYQAKISVFRKRSCVFYPTCSEYGKIAIGKYGALRGGYLLIKRILRCHPWQKNHIDPVK